MKGKRTCYLVLWLVMAILVLLHSQAAHATIALELEAQDESPRMPPWVQYLATQFPHMDLFYKYATQYDLPLTWVLAIASVESRFQPWAMNIAGKTHFPTTKEEALALDSQHPGKSKDYGLGQTNSQWLRRFRLSVEQALEPHVNIMLMSYILNECFYSYGASMLAIGCYHHPPSRDMNRALEYARKVYKRQRQIERSLQKAGFMQG